MSQKVRIPTVLRKFTQDQAALELTAANMRDLMIEIKKVHPELVNNLIDDAGVVRKFINIYVNEDDIRSLQNLETPLADRDEITIIPAIAGG